MGYTTEFAGKFKFDKPLTAAQVAYIKAFNESRRMKRNADLASAFPDPIRLAVGLPLGIDGEFFVGADGFRGQADDRSVVDYNRQPSTQPGLWCQWTVSDDGTELMWDGCEKFYYYADWLRYLIANFFVPWGVKISGDVYWKGEEDSDIGIISVTDNEVKLDSQLVEESCSKSESVKKLLDNGHTVVLRMCGMGIYLAVSVQNGTEASKILDDAIDTTLGWDGIDPVPGSDSVCREFEENMPGVVDTDDFTIEDLLYRITEKATTGRIA